MTTVGEEEEPALQPNQPERPRRPTPPLPDAMRVRQGSAEAEMAATHGRVTMIEAEARDRPRRPTPPLPGSADEAERLAKREFRLTAGGQATGSLDGRLDDSPAPASVEGVKIMALREKQRRGSETPMEQLHAAANPARRLSDTLGMSLDARMGLLSPRPSVDHGAGLRDAWKRHDAPVSSSPASSRSPRRPSLKGSRAALASLDSQLRVRPLPRTSP
jgi:hypothetical protein